MRDDLKMSRSSWLVARPVMLACLLAGALAAFFRQQYLAGLLIFLFVLALTARLWAYASARHISLRVQAKSLGLFPGEEAAFDIQVHNGKFLPVFWLDLFCPLPQNHCMLPRERRRPDMWEAVDLKEEGASEELVGEKRLSFFRWYETARFTSHWTALHRGVCSMEGWRLRTGDGLGLAQIERPIAREDVRQFAVYPKLISVSPDLFLRNLWNADTGTRGVMEDPTVIRSTRDYMTSDSFKQINWRLAARGLPLTVNVYEDILPKSVHFIFDGESFSGPPEHLEEMEDALSILASELVRLHQAQVSCGLSLSQGSSGPAVNYFSAENPHTLLRALAGYQPMPRKWDEEKKEYVSQRAVFDQGAICQWAKRVGRFYYIAYDTSVLPGCKLLQRLDRTQVSVLTYAEGEPFGEFETICLGRLKEGTEHA